MDAGLVEKTWAAVGYKVRPMFAKVFVLTDAPPEKIGSLYLPPKLADFHGGFGHQRLVTATVLACGPLAHSVKPGDRVVFRRLDFGFIVKLERGVYVGFIEQEQLAGFPEGEGDIESLGDSDEGDPTV